MEADPQAVAIAEQGAGDAAPQASSPQPDLGSEASDNHPGRFLLAVFLVLLLALVLIAAGGPYGGGGCGGG